MALKAVCWLHGPLAEPVFERALGHAAGEAIYRTKTHAGQLSFDYAPDARLLWISGAHVTRLRLGAAVDLLDRTKAFHGHCVLAAVTIHDPPLASWLAGIKAKVTAVSAMGAEAASGSGPRRHQLMLVLRTLRAIDADDEQILARLSQVAS